MYEYSVIIYIRTYHFISFFFADNLFTFPTFFTKVTEVTVYIALHKTGFESYLLYLVFHVS